MERDPDEPFHPGQEDLRWGGGVKDKDRKKGNAPSAKYNKLSEQARRLIAGESQCAMFCGGKKCKYCTAENWKPSQMAIKGLYSEWVTDNILAMARPSNYAIDKYDILQQFEDQDIKTVINLQQTGEHASCGYGNDASGFSYNPQHLMDRNIYFYNFAWQDYGIAPMSTLLDIVKVMQFAVATGKVAVHCHAGLGRTGLLIACYLVFNNRVNAGEAVHYVRSRRNGAIQTSQQVQTVLDFETHLKPFRTIFPSRLDGESEVSFKHFLNRQSHLLHGFEARRLKHIPKVVYYCCERLLELTGLGQALSNIPTDSSPASSGLLLPEALSPAASTEYPMLPSFSKLSVHSADNLSALTQPQKSRGSLTLEDLPNVNFKKILIDGLGDEDSGSSTSQDVFMNHNTQNLQPENVEPARNGDINDEEDDDDCIVYGKPDVNVAKMGSEREDSCGNSVDPDLVLNDGQSDESASVENSDKRQKEGKSRLFAEFSCDYVNKKDSCSNKDMNSDKKQKGKRKRLGERLKHRSKTRDAVKSHTVDVNQQEGKEASEGDRKSTESGTGSVGSVAQSDSGSSMSTDTSSSRNIQGSGGRSSSVCEALASMDCGSEVRKKATHIEEQLNLTDSAWALLAGEEDPYVLSTVLWDWLNQLKEPVLTKQDLVLLLEQTGDSPKECLHHVERSVKHFVEYLAVVLSKLLPQTEAQETRLVECLLSHLTHQSVTLSLTFTPQPNQPTHWGEMRSGEASQLVQFFFKLIDEVASPRECSR